jgi:hypothetical protein
LSFMLPPISYPRSAHISAELLGRKEREMRTISLWQPWAAAIFQLIDGSDSDYCKAWETRHWKPSPIVIGADTIIHAAKKKFRSDDYPREFRTRLLMDGIDPFHLKYGVVLGVVRIAQVVKVEEIRDKLSPRELQYGNYDSTCPECGAGKYKPIDCCEYCTFTGIVQRYAWKLENIRRFHDPIEVTGAQGFFYWREGSALIQKHFA